MTRVGATMLGLMLAAGCSGQTGSPGCLDVGACVCDALSGAVLVRATYVEGNAVVATVTVDEVLATSERGLDIAVGYRLQGQPSLGLSCGPSDPPSFAVGAEVFAAFVLSSPLDGGYSGSLALVPWGDELMLARGLSAKSTDITELTDRTTCLARFAPSKPVECDDTVVSTCSTSLPNSTNNADFILLAAVAAALAWIRGRRAR